MVILYAVVFSTVSSLRHSNFLTQTWDMAIFEQTMWNTVHGDVMKNTLEEAPNHLGVHMSPVLFLLVPFYALFQTPYFLLVVQALALGLGALPLYFLSFKKLKKKGLSLAVVFSYLLYPSLHWINLFDFHPISFVVPLVLSSLYFFEVKRRLPAIVFLVLAAMTREDAILLSLFVGIFLLIGGNFRENGKFVFTSECKIGIAVVIVSFIYFILSVKFVMPWLGGGLLRVDRYSHLGASFSEMFVNLFTNPGIFFSTIFTSVKGEYILRLFLPVLFLPFLSWRAFILLIPGLLENFLTNYEPQFSGLYQYDSLLIPGIFIGVIFGLDYLLKRFSEKVLIFVVCVFSIIAFVVCSPLSFSRFPTHLFSSDQREETFREIVRSVPLDAAVVAQTNLVPHLAHRKYVSMLGLERFPVDMIILDGRDSFGFSDADAFQVYLDGYLKTGEFRVKVIDDRFFILTKIK